MRKIRSEVTVQFFIIYEDETVEAYSEPKILKFPDRSKIWKDLKRKVNDERVKSIGWTTPERFQSNYISAFH